MADVEVRLVWTGRGLAFDVQGPAGWARNRLDGSGETGPSPMQMLLLSLAGCMGADVVDILGKMRVELNGLEVSVAGDRAPEPPRRYTRIRVVCRAQGVAAADAAKLERAVALSRETYCSVLHTIRPDTELVTEVVRS